MLTSELKENDIRNVFARQRALSLTLRAERYQERRKRLKRIEKWILANRDPIEQAIYRDFGKPPVETRISEIYPALAELRLIRKYLKFWVRPKSVRAHPTYWGTRSHIAYDPKGVTLIISPWNYPFLLAIGPLLSSLAAGNTAVIKPSELTPHTSALIAGMMKDLFPDDLVAVFEGDKDVSEALLSQPFDHIFFTGSPQVGKIVMASAARHLSSVTLELGGKSPVILDETADLSDAAQKITWGKWICAGQTCLAPDYLLVHRSVVDPLLGHLRTQVERQFSRDSDYCGIVNERHFKRLTELIEEAVDQGAAIEIGGRSNVDENRLGPTVLSGVDPDSVLMQHEIFGPILPVLVYDEFDAAIETINKGHKPLAAYIFSKNNRQIRKFRKTVSSGTMCVNDCVLQFSHPELPFGGVGNSGFGKSHGHFGFLAFSNMKAILQQRRGFTIPKILYPPYTPLKEKILNLLIRYF